MGLITLMKDKQYHYLFKENVQSNSQHEFHIFKKPTNRNKYDKDIIVKVGHGQHIIINQCCRGG